MKKSKKFLIESSVILTALSVRAKKTGKSLKNYFYEEETIKHITLVLYDLLPLSVKIGMRYPKFHEVVERNFKGIRNALLGPEPLREVKKEIVAQKVNDSLKDVDNIVAVVEKSEKKTRKPRITRTPKVIPAKKIASKKTTTLKKVK